MKSFYHLLIVIFFILIKYSHKFLHVNASRKYKQSLLSFPNYLIDEVKPNEL